MIHNVKENGYIAIWLEWGSRVQFTETEAINWIEFQLQRALMAYLNPDIIRTIPTEGVPQHLVNGFGNAVERNVNHRRCGALTGGVYSLSRRSVSDREHEEILHTVHRREVALVVEDVGDGRSGRIIHHQAAVNSGAWGLTVDGGEMEGREEARSGRSGSARLPELEVETRWLGRVGSGEHKWRRTLEVKARDEQRLTRVLHSQQPSLFLFSLENPLQRVFHAPRWESAAAAEHAGALGLEQFTVALGDEVDSVAGGVERPAKAVVGGDHGCEDGPNAGSGDDVEVIGDLRVGIRGMGSDLVLEVDEGRPRDNGGGSSAVDTENAGFGSGFIVGKPLLLEFGEDLERYFAKLHCVEFWRALLLWWWVR